MITKKKLLEYYQFEKIPEYVSHKFLQKSDLTYSEANLIEEILQDVKMIGNAKVSENYKNRVIDKINSNFDDTTRKILLDKMKKKKVIHTYKCKR